MTDAELAAIEGRAKGLPIPLLNVERLCAEVRRLREENARLSSALDAAARVVARKAARAVKTEDCRDCGVNERCEAHR